MENRIIIEQQFVSLMHTYHRTALAALALAPALILTYCAPGTRTPAEVASASIQCILDLEAVLRNAQTVNAKETTDKLGDIHSELQTIHEALSQMSQAQKIELKKRVAMQHGKIAKPMLQCTLYVAELEKTNYRGSEELEQLTRDIQQTMQAIEHRLK